MTEEFIKMVQKIFLMKHVKIFALNQALSGKNVCMCYESHAQSGSACAAGVLLQSSPYMILYSRCVMNSTPKKI